MKRFYKEVAAGEADGGWRITLDGRTIKTAGGEAQIVPTPAFRRGAGAGMASMPVAHVEGDELRGPGRMR